MRSKKRSSFIKDKLSQGIGLFVLVLSLELELFIGIDIQGWGVKTKTLAKISQSAITISKNYENLYRNILLVLFMYACQTLFLYNYKQSTKSYLEY